MCLFFVTDTPTTEIYPDLHTLSLHDALPIYADRSDHRIEREDDVDGEYLRDGRGERGGLATAVPAAVSALDVAVDLRGRLYEQEEAAAHQDDVAPGYFQVEDLEQRRG